MSFLKILFNPIFLLAAGLHAGLLLIPVAGGSSDDIVPAPDPEGESITVTRIPPTTEPQTKVGVDRSNQASPKAPTRSAASNGQAASSGSKAKSGSQNRVRTGGNAAANENDNPSAANPAPSGGLPPLPPNNNGGGQTGPTAEGGDDSCTPVEVTLPSDTDAPRTLVSLKDGVQDRGIPQLLQDFLALFQHSVLQTTDEELEEAKRLWLAELDESGLEVSVTKELEMPLKINYPLMIEDDGGPRQLRSCLDPLPAKGVMGVIVDRGGEIATEPTLLRSSGYGAINNVALAKIKDYTDFPNESSNQAYTVEIDVDYDKDACLDLTKLKK